MTKTPGQTAHFTKPATMAFRKATSRLAPSAARRQGDVTRLAVTMLGREAAIAFMNADHARLGGRPIDLVIASEKGSALVEDELARAGIAATVGSA